MITVFVHEKTLNSEKKSMIHWRRGFNVVYLSTSEVYEAYTVEMHTVIHWSISSANWNIVIDLGI